MPYLIKSELKSKADPKKAKILQKFFKTGKGEYGEGDVFLGISVPEQRKIANKHFKETSLKEIEELLESKIHEERFTALEILVMKYGKANETERKEIFNFYIKNSKKINNWDLVDTSAPYIFGRHILFTGKENPFNQRRLMTFANSENLWEKRIAIVSTQYFIKNNRFDETLMISESLLKDKHDLIHKAVGWMLREVGKKDEKILKDFLKKYYKQMPRTMLRYSIEKFDKKTRKQYLNGDI